MLRLIYRNEPKQMIFGRNNIEKLYDLYAEKLYNTSLRITANPMDAEEAMQDAFIKYHCTKAKDGIENIGAWLTRVCVRNSIDIIRKRRAGALPIEEIPPSEMMSLHTRQPEDAEYSVDMIKASMLKLPDGCRTILSLHLFEGYDYTEISEIMDLKESSIRSQYMRARKKLSEILMNKQ